ncbi:hypothetical protein chiPu_0024881, partial [Chiloscyllium punctatum]|nr:hypothetical protein [Chiloscyllium punctatum]
MKLLAVRGTFACCSIRCSVSTDFTTSTRCPGVYPSEIFANE